MNTLENKAKFFAQYWGQLVYKNYQEPLGLQNCQNDKRLRIGNTLKNSWLELKTLSSISDEDAIEVLNILMGTENNMYNDWHPNIQNNWLKTIKIDLLDGFGSRQTGMLPYFKDTWRTGDYLRSKGYALPWNGITVEELIEFGWIKLK